MMFKILCLLGVLSSAACNSPAKQFCFPKQWQSYVSYVNATSEGKGTIEISPGEAVIFVDDADDKFRTDIYNSYRTVTIIVLYKENAGYYIEGKNCTKFEPGPKYNTTLCTPKNASISKPYYLGYKPNINVVDYSFPLFISNAVFSVADNTAPVALRLFETLSGAFSLLTTILFEDYSPTKPDPKVFVVPDICKHVQQGNDNMWQTWASKPVWEMMQ